MRSNLKPTQDLYLNFERPKELFAPIFLKPTQDLYLNKMQSVS